MSAHLLSCCALAFTATALASLDSAGVGPENDGRWLVAFKQGAKANVRNAVRNANGNVRKEFDDIKVIAVNLPNQQAADVLSKRSDVEYVEEDFRRYPMAETTPYGVDKVQAKAVWNATANPSKGQGVVVCIIDGGLSLNHEDLADVSIANTNPYSEWGFDGCNHGNHVAGTIAAQMNDLGVVGVAPDVTLYIVRVFSGPNCDWVYASDVIGALKECILGNASVVSMSLGGSGYSLSSELAFEQSFSWGVLSVAAAGNDGNSVSAYPASYPSVMSVAGTDSNNEIYAFSQYNSEVDIAAPGVGVLSTVMGFADSYVQVWDNATEKTSLEHDVMEGSGEGTANGLLHNMNSICESTDDWSQASGKVVHCLRGEIDFRDKVDYAVANGAIGVIVSNTEDSLFGGTLGGSVSVPVVSVSSSSGSLLQSMEGFNAEVFVGFDPTASAYEAYDGTSMATPHVSAVAALLISAKPGASVTQVRDCIYQTALDLGDEGRDDHFGHGLVQASAAHSCLIEMEFTTKTPTTTSTSTTTTAFKNEPICHHFMQYPTDFCFTYTGTMTGSKERVCVDGLPYKKSYHSQDCSGRAYLTVALDSYPSMAGYQWSCDDGMDACEYSLVENQFWDVGCNEETYGVVEAYIMNQCFVMNSAIAGKYEECTGSGIKYKEFSFESNDNPCAGEFFETMYKSHECEDGTEIHYCGGSDSAAVHLSTLLSAAFCLFVFCLI